MEKTYTYDDIQIVPAYSTIESRSDCNLTTQFTKNYKIGIPLIAAPMSSICESLMAKVLQTVGGVGIIHRFNTIQAQCHEASIVANACYSERYPICAAIGATDDFFERAEELLKIGVNVLLIDVAHGYHKNVERALNKLISLRSTYMFDIIAGNVAEMNGAKKLVEWGADAIRVGIGGGSVCTTRISTGIGIPQATAILNSAVLIGTDIPIIADGGIRYPGDVAKALGLGASSVMLGSMFSGTIETPGEYMMINDKKVKRYYGSASETQKHMLSKNGNNVEGVSTFVEDKGSVLGIVNKICDGIRSAMSYVGARNIIEFKRDARFVEVSHAGAIEAHPHLLLR
jgi:IMP dehydrogenase